MRMRQWSQGYYNGLMTRIATPLNADLHCHSRISDGVLAPDELARRARRNGVDLWSLTDHDELSGLAEAASTCEEIGLHFIPGVEVSATWAGKTVHIVGLNIDPGNQALKAGLQAIRSGRVERAQKIAKRLEAMGVSGSYEGAVRYASNPQLLSRTHFARFLLEEGYCRSMQEVFNRYLGDERSGNVHVHWSKLEEAVGWITGAGGRAVIAHPGRYTFDTTQADAFFDAFKQLGGEGLEVITGSHKPEQYNKYVEVALRYGFLASRGSDFHAPGESHIDLGELPSLPSRLRPVWHDWA